MRKATMAGYSSHFGVRKFRATARREYVFDLLLAGDTDIVMFDLPYPMSRKEARDWVINNQHHAPKIDLGIKVFAVVNMQTLL